MQEVCERTGKTRQTVHYWVSTGKLRKFERGIGCEAFFLEDEVEELMRIRQAA